MAIIKPFKALRYNSKFYDDMSSLVCPPYDVIKNSEIEGYLNKSPYNFIRIELPKSESSYSEVRTTFEDWKENNILIKDEKENIYFYEINFNVDNKEMKLIGIICLVKIENFGSGDIIPHENTFENAKADRFFLLKTINCNTSPIYSLFDGRDGNILKNLSGDGEIISAVDSEGFTHKLQEIKDYEKINKITKYFENKKLFIADGHHRYETAINYKNYCNGLKNKNADYAMMLLVDFFSDALIVLPTHRVVKFNKNFDITKLNDVFNKYFFIEERRDIYNIENVLSMRVIAGEKSIGFYCGEGTWTLLKFKGDFNIDKFSCETQLLNDLVLDSLLKGGTVSQISYTRDIDEVYSLANSDESVVTFIMPKMIKEDLFNIFLKNMKLPQKTTYFYPKPITGFLMNEIEF